MLVVFAIYLLNFASSMSVVERGVDPVRIIDVIPEIVPTVPDYMYPHVMFAGTSHDFTDFADAIYNAANLTNDHQYITDKPELAMMMMYINLSVFIFYLLVNRIKVMLVGYYGSQKDTQLEEGNAMIEEQIVHQRNNRKTATI